MFALCFVLGGIVLVNAQDTTSNQYNKNEQQYPQDQQMQGQQQDRQRIQTTELPDAVKRTLEDQEYRGWLVSGAFKASANQSSMDSTGVSGDQNRQGNNNAIGTEDQEIYLVELKNGAETKTVAFDKDGERIEGWEDQSNQNGENGQNNQYNQSDSTQNDQMNQNDQRQDSQSYQKSESDQNSQSTDQNSQSTDQNSQSTDQNNQSSDKNSQRDQQSTSPDQSGQSSSSGDLQKDQK